MATYVYVLHQEDADDSGTEMFVGVYATEAAAIAERDMFLDGYTSEIYDGRDPYHIRRELLRK